MKVLGTGCINKARDGVAGLLFSVCMLLSPAGVTEVRFFILFFLKICIHLSDNQCCTSMFVVLCFLGNQCGFVLVRRDLSNNRLVAIPPNLFVLLGDLLQL